MASHRRGRPPAPAAGTGLDGEARATRPPGPVAVAVAAVLLAWVILAVLHGGAWTDLDHAVSEQVRRTGVRAAEWPQPLFWPKLGVYAVTQLGAWLPVFAVLVPFVGWVSWRRTTWRPLFRLAVAAGLLVATVYTVKVGVGRTPPATDVLHSPTGRSFPSRHLPTAVVCWGLAAWLAAEHRLAAGLRRPLAVARWAAPALTCAAMLLLDYHWLSDLVAGLALGVLLLRVLHLVDAATLRDWRNERGQPPSEPGGDRGVPAGTGGPAPAHSGVAGAPRRGVPTAGA